MTATAPGGAATFDVAALRRGVENRDLDSLLSLYDDSAEVRVVDQRHTPSSPQVLRGRAEIRPFLADVLGREMTHQLDHVLVSGSAVSYVERCTYPDGSRVTGTSVLDLEHGRIIRQELVQAWDAGQPPARYQDFSSPDEVRIFEKGRLDLVRTPAGEVGRMTLEPGWRWSEHVKPIAGTDLCQASHAGYQISGTLRIELADGTVIDARPGQVGTIPPGHDAWVVGDEKVVLLDWAGATDYARG